MLRTVLCWAVFLDDDSAKPSSPFLVCDLVVGAVVAVQDLTELLVLDDADAIQTALIKTETSFAELTRSQTLVGQTYIAVHDPSSYCSPKYP